MRGCRRFGRFSAQQGEQVADFFVHLGFIGDGSANLVPDDGAKLTAQVQGRLFDRAFAHPEGGGDFLILCGAMAGEKASQVQKKGLAVAGFEPGLQRGQRVVINSPSPAAVEGFLGRDVAGDGRDI